MASNVIKAVAQGRGQICNDLLRSLPRWFGIEDAIRQYVVDVERMHMLVAYEDHRPVGFAALNLHNEWTAEVHVMAVHPEFHRRGIGKRLLEFAEVELRQNAYRFLTVKTLSPARVNKEYAMTRDFYFAMGFRPVEEFKTLWGEGNPCLLMLKTL